MELIYANILKVKIIDIVIKYVFKIAKSFLETIWNVGWRRVVQYKM